MISFPWSFTESVTNNYVIATFVVFVTLVIVYYNGVLTMDVKKAQVVFLLCDYSFVLQILRGVYLGMGVGGLCTLAHRLKEIVLMRK